MAPKLSDSVTLTNFGFDWGDMAIERCFEHKGYRCIRIRSMTSGKWVDVQMSPSGRNLWASETHKDKRLKGFNPSGGKKIIG